MRIAARRAGGLAVVDWTTLRPLTAFALGIVGSLVLGTGMCLSMGVLGSGTAATGGGK